MTISAILENCDDRPPFVLVDNIRVRRVYVTVPSRLYPGHEARSVQGSTAYLHCYKENDTLWVRPGHSPYSGLTFNEILNANVRNANLHETMATWATFTPVEGPPRHCIVDEDIDFAALAIEVIPHRGAHPVVV